MKAVLFDLFHTLLSADLGGEREGANRRIAALLEVDPVAFDREFSRAARERYTGELGDLTATIRVIAGRVGAFPSPARLRAAVAIRHEMTTGLLARVSSDTLSILDGVRAAGWRVGLVSNTTPDTPGQWRATPLRTRFDAAVFSSEVGFAKPDAEIYLAACEKLGVPPAQCVYLGDGADRELPAAAALGMRAIRTTQFANSDPGWAGPVIASLAELPGIL